MPLVFDGVDLGEGFKIDILVEKLVLVEIKSVIRVHPVHRMQVLTYLRLTRLRLGLLLNFTALRLFDGYERIVNGL